MQYNQQILQLIDVLRQMPGVGRRSARRIALHLIGKDPGLAKNIIDTLNNTLTRIKICALCHNVDTDNPCHICTDTQRDQSTICIIEQVLDLWSMENFKIHYGLYHILGGLLSVTDDVKPENLNLKTLWQRFDNATEIPITEVIIALNATTESDITTFYLTNILKKYNVKISILGRGMPMGGELDYLDEGTVSEAFKSRKLI